MFTCMVLINVSNEKLSVAHAQKDKNFYWHFVKIICKLNVTGQRLDNRPITNCLWFQLRVYNKFCSSHRWDINYYYNNKLFSFIKSNRVGNFVLYLKKIIGRHTKDSFKN